MEWIDVNERLPEISDVRVLVTDGRKFYIITRNAMFKNASGQIEIPANYGKGAIITHWMPIRLPIPEPPKENEK